MTATFRRPIVIGNWKMQGSCQMITDFVSHLSYFKNFKGLEVVLCPPTLYIQQLKTTLHAYNCQASFGLGAQNVYCESSGAFTGETAPDMLIDMGCRYVIVGHSERRQLFFEDDTLIARKGAAAYHAGLIPILCVGETAEQRKVGKTAEVICGQLEAILEKLPIKALATSVIAYEPVWAIGTGLTATPEQAEAVHLLLRDWIGQQDAEVAKKVRILYGGSVKAENAAGLLGMSNIDGALVGGASINAEQFLKICEAAFKLKAKAE